MNRIGYPIAVVAAIAFIGCGKTAAPPMAQDMAAPVTESATTLVSAKMSITGMH